MYGDSVKREGDDLELESEHDQEIAGIGKKKRRPANLCISCPVCGGPAPDHVHFGGKTLRDISAIASTFSMCRAVLLFM